MRCHTSSFSSSPSALQEPISAIVRQQPRHSPVAGFMAQIWVQGEGTATRCPQASMGGALTALDLDTGRTAAVPSRSYQSIED